MNEMNLSINPKISPGGVEFLGVTSSLITYSDLSTHFGVTQGAINTTAIGLQNAWLQFKIDGKEIYVSKVAIRSSITWDFLYSKGLVYGTNDNGKYPTGTATNQLKTITLNGKLYKCRLLKGCNEDQNPYTHIPGVESGNQDPPNSYISEVNRLFYPIITNDPYAKSYIGPKLADYINTDLQMQYVSAVVTPGGFNWCQESAVTNSIWRIARMAYGPSYLGWTPSSTIDSSLGWRPCLELI